MRYLEVRLPAFSRAVCQVLCQAVFSRQRLVRALPVRRHRRLHRRRQATLRRGPRRAAHLLAQLRDGLRLQLLDQRAHVAGHGPPPLAAAPDRHRHDLRRG